MKILIWLAAVVLSLILIAPNPFQKGVQVTDSGTNASFAAGDIIYRINGEDATEQVVSRDYYGLVKADTSKGQRIVQANGSLDIDVEPLASSNLKFGLDIKGGTRALIKVTSNQTDAISQSINTLQTRINVYGLRESVFRSIENEYIEISIAGGSRQELEELLEKQGKFEARIPLKLQNNGSLVLDRTYTVILDDSSLRIPEAGITAREGETFVLDDIPFYVGSSDPVVNLTSTVYTGKDIVAVFSDPQRSRIEKTANGYTWSFSLQISDHGAKKFALITNNIPRRIDYLEEPISLYLDDNLIDSLNIAANLKGQQATEILVTGGASSYDEAVWERVKLQSILRSGALPGAVEIMQIDTISPTLGEGFLRAVFFAGMLSAGGVALVVFARYRKIQLVLPMLIVSLSEVIIILGASVVIGWTIDLAALAGIIATVGTGIDSQIIMIDQSLRKEERATTLREKLKHAFFIIFGSAGVMIAAMLPLLTLGFGLLRGFAITTMIGVLAGILLARPAFGVIIEKLVGESRA